MNELIDPQALQVVSKTPPDEARHKKRAETFVAMAGRMTVDTQEDFELAAGELRAIKTFWSELEAERTSFTQPLNALLDRLNARFQPYLKALCGDGKAGTVSAESIIKGKMAAFQQAERIRLAAEQAERERLAAAERQRLADEAAAVLRKAEEEAATQPHAAEAIIAQAQAQAAALEQTAAVVIARPVEAPARVSGVSSVKALDVEVTDKAEFLRFVLDKRPDLLGLWEPDAAKLRALAKLQGVATAIPGLRVFEKTGITVRKQP